MLYAAHLFSTLDSLNVNKQPILHIFLIRIHTGYCLHTFISTCLIFFKQSKFISVLSECIINSRVTYGWKKQNLYQVYIMAAEHEDKKRQLKMVVSPVYRLDL